MVAPEGAFVTSSRIDVVEAVIGEHCTAGGGDRAV
ncbi:MAG: hypothetical protein K0R62_8502, partial [Nonomuraea muscovyensis]|nr:hypothetical protein [Nonomuraea muscovyensis]